MKAELKKKLNEKIFKDILTFFYENPSSIDSVGGVSTWVSGSRSEVSRVLNELVVLGILEKISQGATKGFSYTRDKKVMKIVKDLMGKN